MNPISTHMVGDEVGVGGQEELEPGKEGLLWNIWGWPKTSFRFSCKPCTNLLSKPILLIHYICSDTSIFTSYTEGQKRFYRRNTFVPAIFYYIHKKCDCLPEDLLVREAAYMEARGCCLHRTGSGDTFPQSGLLVAVSVLVDMTSLRQPSLMVQSESKL